MAEAAKGINPEITPEAVTEEIKEVATEVKEEVREAPSRIREKLSQLAAVWEGSSVRPRVSESDVVEGTGLGGMYGAKFQALAKEYERTSSLR
jgi:hypothetical protein